MIAKLEKKHSNLQQNMEQTQTPQWKQQSTTNQQQQNRCLRMTNPFLVICTEKQYSENVSKDEFDNNTRLKISSQVCLTDTTGISFYIVSI